MVIRKEGEQTALRHVHRHLRVLNVEGVAARLRARRNGHDRDRKHHYGNPAKTLHRCSTNILPAPARVCRLAIPDRPAAQISARPKAPDSPALIEQPACCATVRDNPPRPVPKTIPSSAAIIAVEVTAPSRPPWASSNTSEKIVV